MKINLVNVNKSYGEKQVFVNFNMQIEKGKITAILGESGSGKTTLLNIIANLTDFSGKTTGMGKVSYVFQKDRLIKHLTIEENLKLVSPNCNVEEELKKVGMQGYSKSYISELSGGMSRRVAILRGLNYKNDTLLLDEPFTNLDLSHKEDLIKMIKKRQRAEKNTVIMVTHDVYEAVRLANRIIVLSKGQVIYDDKKITPQTEKRLRDVLIKIKD